jgi:hypothetical protein
MQETTKNSEQVPDVKDIFEPEKPGFYERIGLWYFKRLAAKDNRRGKVYDLVDDDDRLVWAVRRVTYLGALVAFTVGGISAGGSVYTELIFEGASPVVLYGWLAGVTIVLTAIEFAVLFWISIRTVFYIARITGHNRISDDGSMLASFIPNLLARAALEIPDPVTSILGIDPLARVSKRKLLLIGLLYKGKIMLSNVLAKLFLRRVLGKSILRVSVSYIAVAITGLWNMLVLLKVVREARLRLFGNLIANHLVEQTITEEKLEKLSERARIGCLQAVGNSVVINQRYHPNMLILALRLAELLEVKGGSRFDDWDEFIATLDAVTEPERYFLLDLLCVATAFDGKISRMEKRILHKAFREHTELYFARIYRLKKLMLSGRLNEAIKECDLDFQPG